MKTIIASALTAAALFTGAANAASLDNEVTNFLPNADYSNLSDVQVNAINAAVHAGDDYNTTRSVIRSILK
ncbi:hypothetical protein [Sagittula sp. SSi028]|uniref:hypothetical protein n=1 Tax=Sagittula sp. SSi028 TaxID=3400636 RepID=UPI003AF7DEC3